MPTSFFQSLVARFPALQTLQYLDFGLILQDLNTPYIWAVVAGSVFVLFLTFASFRHHLFKTSMDGAGVGVVIGILITLTVQSILVYKFVGFSKIYSLVSPTDKTASSETSSPAVLGIDSTCTPSSKEVQKFFLQNDSLDSRKLRLQICQDLLEEIK